MTFTIQEAYKKLEFVGEPDINLIEKDKNLMYINRVLYEYNAPNSPKHQLIFDISAKDKNDGDKEIIVNGDAYNDELNLIDTVIEATKNSVIRFIQTYIEKNPNRYLNEHNLSIEKNSSSINNLFGKKIILNAPDSLSIMTIPGENEEIFFN